MGPNLKVSEDTEKREFLGFLPGFWVLFLASERMPLYAQP
jgi:hypothetical protein